MNSQTNLEKESLQDLIALYADEMTADEVIAEVEAGHMENDVDEYVYCEARKIAEKTGLSHDEATALIWEAGTADVDGSQRRAELEHEYSEYKKDVDAAYFS